MTAQVAAFGPDADLITVPAGMRPAALAHALASRYPHLSVRPGLDTILLHGAHRPTPADIHAVITAVDATASTGSTEHMIPVTYDGQDLEAIARLWDSSIDDVVAAHTGTTWNVALIGFAPGFPYLTPTTNAHLWTSVPRLATPRPRVPAGAVAVAAGMSAVYPSTMPGGWQLLGHTTVPLFDVTRATPNLLAAGDIVRFVTA